MSRATGRIDEALMAPIRKHLARGKRRTLPAGAYLVVPGEPCRAFAYVEKGLIQSTLLRSNGEHVLIGRIGPGSICGEGPLLHGLPPAVEMVALEPTQVVLFDTRLTQKLFREDPAFGHAIATVLSVKYLMLLTRFGALTDRRPAERLMSLLEWMSRNQGDPHPRGKLVRTRMTHEDLGAMTGLSRVTVTRSLAALRKTGTLDLVKGRYLVIAPAG